MSVFLWQQGYNAAVVFNGYLDFIVEINNNLHEQSHVIGLF